LLESTKILWKAMLLALVAVIPRSNGSLAAASSITLYTSQSEADARRTASAFEEIHPEFRVNWERSGASEMLVRLQSEHREGKPSADVVQFADMLTMEALKAEHLLARYRDASVGDIPARFLDADFRYFGSKTMNTGIAYRTDAEIVPSSWNDLLSPAVRDRVVLPSPVYAGTASVFLASMKAAPGFGLEYFDRLKANRATLVPVTATCWGAAVGQEVLRRHPRLHVAARRPSGGAAAFCVAQRRGEHGQPAGGHYRRHKEPGQGVRRFSSSRRKGGAWCASRGFTR
jgi:iron(III) transport system substrate-binding protein